MRRPSLTILRRLPGIVLAALSRPITEPQVVVLFLVVNLGLATILALPLSGLLAAELDDNLYGEEMATGASWRWFDTVSRQHPHAVGSLGAWTVLLSDEGARPRDLARMSGPAAAVAVAGLLLYLLHAVLHTGYLASGRWRSSEGRAAGLLHRAALFALPALALAVIAAAGYVAAYGLAYVATGPPLARLAETAQSESLHLLFVWVRLILTLILCLAVKLWSDLAKAALVEVGSWNLWRAATRAGRELVRRGWAYALVSVPLAGGTLLLAALWLLVSAPLVPRTWIGLTLVFLFHQLVLALRIVLRLGQLGATQGVLLVAAVTPPSPRRAAPEPGQPAPGRQE
ncbi:MAG TPA: hypothetical protein VM617_03945 [Thermoanaerobaculia bacterium]|nr:hypothetical protein [Thermoanaerobaculia bacterium]